MAQDGFQSLWGNTARIGQVNLVMPPVELEAVLFRVGLHQGNRLVFAVVRPNVEHLHAKPLGQGLEPDFANSRTFASLQQGRDSFIKLICPYEIRSADEELPAPSV